MSSGNLVQLIKKIAMEAVRTAKMSDYVIGVVTSVEPLKVKLTNAFEIDEEFLQLTRNVTDYVLPVKVGERIEKRQILNGLKTGDTVLLIRKSGGQEYMIMDRVVSE